MKPYNYLTDKNKNYCHMVVFFHHKKTRFRSIFMNSHFFLFCLKNYTLNEELHFNVKTMEDVFLWIVIPLPI